MSDWKKKAAKMGYVGLFADRETIQEAYDYAMNIADRLRPEDKVTVVTAISVLQNTWAKLIAQKETKLEKL